MILRRFLYGLMCALIFALGCRSGSLQSGSQAEGFIDPPSDCSPERPDCSFAQDFPEDEDLDMSNSSSIDFSDFAEGLALPPDSSSIVDSDNDGVPDAADDCPGLDGWAEPCDGDPENDGIFHTLFYDPGAPGTVGGADDIVTGTAPRSVDVYFLVDATDGMAGEILNLQVDLMSGTFADTGQCPTAVDEGIVGALQCYFPNVNFGVGLYREYPLFPLAPSFSQTPYHHILDLTDDTGDLQQAILSLDTAANSDDPEAVTQALYSVATGMGLGEWVPNRADCPDFEEPNLWGYPCFREHALPFIINITDAQAYNGPRPGLSPEYGDPPFSTGVGVATNIPPAVTDASVLYSNDIASAIDIGILNDEAFTILGMSTLFTNDLDTGIQPGCLGPDGKDAVFLAHTDPIISPVIDFDTFGTHFPNSLVGLFTLDFIDSLCDDGTISGTPWATLNTSIVADLDFLVVVDGDHTSGLNEDGAYQLRIDGLGVASPDWLTVDTPIIWTDVETALTDNDIKIASIVSPSAFSGVFEGIEDAEEMGVLTGSVDGDTDPYLQTVDIVGTGMGQAVTDAAFQLQGNTPRNIMLILEDDPDTMVDESQFLHDVEVISCPANCGGQTFDQCTDCLGDGQALFRVRFNNDVVPGSSGPDVFETELVVTSTDGQQVERIPVRIFVPGVDASFPSSGSYWNTYDSAARCEIPPERPDWGEFNWDGEVPSDSTIDFEFRAADTVGDLDTVTPVTVTIPTDTTDTTFDSIGDILVAGGDMNFRPYLRVTAVLNPSTDMLESPTLEGWTLEFVCQDFE